MGHDPPVGTARLQTAELPPVVAALDAGEDAWVRGAHEFLDAHGIELVTGDFACGGFPEGRPWATILGALLLYNHRAWLPTDRAQQRYLAWQGWRLGARLARGIGEHAAARYMRAWDEIVGDGGKGAVRRFLEAADAAATPAWPHLRARRDDPCRTPSISGWFVTALRWAALQWV
jgi:hypothetical protein